MGKWGEALGKRESANKNKPLIKIMTKQQESRISL